MTKQLPVLAFLSLAALCSAITGAPGAEFTPEFRTLGLGQAAGDIVTEGYGAFACGSNGGPPLASLSGWTDFMKCEPEANGLREVYAEFGRQAGQMAELFREQYDDELWIQKFVGTRMANFPVVLSLLFDESGIVRGYRAVTDARAPLQDRGKAYLFRFPIYERYGSEGWDCVERDPAPGETGVGKVYLNEVCEKDVDQKHVRVEAHFFRKPGQTGTDINGMFEPGQFESLTRWEVFDRSYTAATATP
ncbi:MAG: hypothetical protein JWQ89_3179 [Devosia sp.]|uniref:hypothetical protein n=1 Tax=Devosia sp. TaxID=1871048 RepID=UPI002616BB4C|nr:hypothetical protein [Devosia sp.]MDB5541452.1 hypothetical protein [Devosia sp.]